MLVKDALKITDSFTKTGQDAWPELQLASVGLPDWLRSSGLRLPTSPCLAAMP